MVLTLTFAILLFITTPALAPGLPVREVLTSATCAIRALRVSHEVATPCVYNKNSAYIEVTGLIHVGSHREDVQSRTTK